MEKFIITIMVCCLPFYVFSADYYVSSSTGNDSNDGLTEATAWKTTTKVRLSLTNADAGKVIAFKAGDTWTNEYFYLLNIDTSTGNEIVFTSYGSGAKPIFDMVTTNTPTWTDIGGNVWKTPTSVVGMRRIKFDGTEVLGTGLLSELGASVPDLVRFYYDRVTYDLYIYSTDTPENHTIEYSESSYAFFISGVSYIIFDGLEFRGGSQASAKIKDGSNITFKNCIFGNMANYGIYIGGNCSDVNITDCIFDAGFTLDYSNTTQNTGDTEQRGGADGLKIVGYNRGNISGNIFKNWGHEGVALSNADCLNIKIYNNIFSAPDIAYGGRLAIEEGANNNEIYNNIFENMNSGSQIEGHDNHYHHNIHRNLNLSPIKSYPFGALGLQGYGTFGTIDNVYENNIFLDCGLSGMQVSGNNGGGNVTGNILRNNIIYNCGSEDSNIGLIVYTDSNTFSNDGNIFVNNLIYNTTENNVIEYYGTSMDVVTFNAKIDHSHTIDSNISEDPLLVSSSDYHLQSNSPAINAGTIPLSIIDYSRNAIPNDGTLPDIGIYEFYENTTGSINVNAGSDQSICVGESVTLTASEGSTYKWSTGATTQSITASPNTTTTYTVEVSEGSASDSDTVTVAVSSVTANAGSNKTIYEGESATLIASGGDSYIWSNGSRSKSITVSPQETQNYTLTAYKGSCEDTDTVQVTVNKKDTSPPPAKANAGEDQTICLGDHVKLTASGGKTYAWNTGETTKSITINPTRTTSYAVTATRGGVTNSDVVVVTVENCSVINDGDKKEELHIYPNPTSGIINISIKNVNKEFVLFISDVKGSIVYREETTSKNDDFYRKIDLSDFDRGVYFLGLNTTNINKVKKLLIVDR